VSIVNEQFPNLFHLKGAIMLFAILGLGFCESFVLVVVGMFCFLCWMLGKAVKAAAESPIVHQTALEALWNWLTGD